MPTRFVVVSLAFVCYLVLFFALGYLVRAHT
jgi:hypothetical protein